MTGPEARTETEASVDPDPVLLLVDDDPINLRMLMATLEGEGYRLLAATSGEGALKIAAQAHPDLILLDIQMPGIDGYETCRRLKADKTSRDSAVIFLTALQDTREKVKGLSIGAVDFLTKPFDSDEIRARVARQLQIHRQQAALRRQNRELSERLRSASGSTADDLAIDGAQLRDLILQGENDTVEFKSTLRWNLKTEQKDKAVEKAWLKTLAAFLNTDGGTLLLGVEDNGKILGTAPDRFDSNDKYLLHVNNCIQQHIGLANTGSIRYGLIPHGDAHVLAIRCRPSPDPVFLRIGKEEEFYIRVGPGSRKLSPSEVLAYVARREPFNRP
jgi:DNA-binding response OmpR family regulator